MTQPAFGQIAPISRRAVAYLLDAVIAGGLAIVLSGILIAVAVTAGSPEGTLTAVALGAPLVSLLLLGWFIVYTLMQAGKGSIGMRAQSVRLVDAATGEPVGFWRALLRNVIFGLAGAIVVGYFSPLFDGSGRFQGWHDKVAKTLVTDARNAAATAAQSQPGQNREPQTRAMPQSAQPRLDLAGQPPLPPQGYQVPPLAPPVAHPVASPASSTPPLPTAGPTHIPAPAPIPFGNPVRAQPTSEPALDETVVPPRPPAPAVAPPEAAASPAQADAAPLIAFVPGITQDAPARSTPPTPVQPAPTAPAERPAEPAAPAAPATPADSAASAAPEQAAAPASFVPPEDDDIEQTRISVPGHRLVFIWDDGTRVSVSRRTLFGRNPAHEEGAVVVPVRDETLSLSKTHFEAAAETSGGWVQDRNSTNGTTIIRDGARIACAPGERVPIKLGDVISIGDRIVTVGGYE